MKQVFFQVLTLLALAILFFVLARGVWLLWQKSRLAEFNLEVSKADLVEITERKLSLEKKLTKLKTSRGLEEEIRTNFSVIKPGEKLINLVEDKPATETASTTSKRSWWQYLPFWR